MKVLHHYDSIGDHSELSASVVIDYLLNDLLFKPSSAIDIGCGLGQWLKVLNTRCSASILGIDGSHVPPRHSFISESNRARINLEDYLYLPTPKRYDLAICLEVAEHLSFDHSDQLIQKLTDSSDTILFSAAIPGQTGENHVNEQPHIFWLEKFQRKGFLVFDPFRKRFWNDARVNWWYAQNMFLVCKPSGCTEQAKIYKYDHNMYVHPALLHVYRSSLCKPSEGKFSSLSSKVKSLVKHILR